MNNAPAATYFMKNTVVGDATCSLLVKQFANVANRPFQTHGKVHRWVNNSVTRWWEIPQKFFHIIVLYDHNILHHIRSRHLDTATCVKAQT